MNGEIEVQMGNNLLQIPGSQLNPEINLTISDVQKMHSLISSPGLKMPPLMMGIDGICWSSPDVGLCSWLLHLPDV